MISAIVFIEVAALLLSFTYCIKKLSNKEIRHKIILGSLILIYTSVYGYFYYYIPTEIYTILTILMTALIAKFFMNMNNKDCLFYVTITWLIAIILDIVTMNVMNKIFNKNDLLGRIIGTGIVILIYYIISNCKYFVNKISILKKHAAKIDFSYYKLILIVLLYFVLGSLCLKNMEDRFLTASILCIAISIIFIIILYIFQLSQIKSLKESLRILTKNNEFYIERIDEYRIMKHNLIANLSSIKTTANKNTKLLIDDLILRYQSILKMPKSFKDLPSGVNGIIYEKIYNIQDKTLNISIVNKIKNNVIDVMTARDYNTFCEAISVALDNAIEAAEKSDEKLLFLEFTEDKERLTLKIINSFSGTIDIDALGSKNYTSKKTGNGIGLFSILRFNSIKTSTFIKNNKFICIIKATKNE